MKKIILLSSHLICLFTFSQDWTWVRGANNGSVTGSYGTIGVPSPTNDPGARHGSASWIDAAGNLWLFGGEGFATSSTEGQLNDLWRYNPTTNQWAWIKGSNSIDQPGVYGTMNVPAPTNQPGGREFIMYWKDNNGNFWLFGGEGYDAFGNFGRLNDLWRYNTTTNQWTWMKGSNSVNQAGTYGPLYVALPFTTPGARYGGVTWVDSNNDLWLFGGFGMPGSGPPGHLNDLWKYETATNQWAYMSGSQLSGQTGDYGTKGMPAPTNQPGGRMFPSAWTDANGTFWLFGGLGYPATVPVGYLNDLWSYNTTSNMWTYMSGSSLSNEFGTYGTLTIPSPTNNPGGRYSAAAVYDNGGRLWLFGGNGYGQSTGTGMLNDVWRYTPGTDEWTWMKGSNAVDQIGVYGTMGISAPANSPGGRRYNAAWISTNDDFWIFGSYGYPNNNTEENMNDLWKYKIPPCAPVNITNTVALTICNGYSTTLSVSSASTSTVTWYSSPTSTTVLGTGNSFATPTLATGTYTYYAQASFCNNRTPITVSVSACTGIQNLSGEYFSLIIYPNPSNGEFSIKTNITEVNFVIYNMLGQEVFKKEIFNEESLVKTNLARGVYYYSVTERGTSLKSGKLVLE